MPLPTTSPTHDETLFGRRPVVPNAPDYIASLRKTVQGNIDLVPSLSQLATKSTKLYSELMETARPGITALGDKATSIIGDLLAGKLPDDVRREIEMTGAARAGASGVGASIGGAGTARDIGLTSFQVQQSGLSALSRWQEQSRAGVFDFSKLFFGPQEAIQQADTTFNRDWLESEIAFGPDPAARGRHDSNQAIWGMAMGAYGGGPGYTQQYKPSYQGANDSNARYQSGNSSYFGAQERMVNDMEPMGSAGGAPVQQGADGWYQGGG